VVAADQVTKSVAEAHLTHAVHVLGPFGLALRYNSGSAFSLFAGDSAVLGVVGVALVLALVAAAWRARRTWVAVSLGLVIGGAVGNLADRLCRGHHGQVTDFITLSHWPTFNVADACISAGIVLLVLSFWRRPAEAPTAGDVGHDAEPASAGGSGR
jgi:signal peptidase II